ncbi:hypothetical protein ANACOL_01315 [Anaerotruncus colihominis DSM 17241]|uniref:Uncharacterized protein n=1 Tax=Anaerotruncus colihominis DSM 17241 TaxID=445972 RepID=B0P969_9FIRM|nr:hypothetical protein ANACOL_01315 [Anaerotruncus colihominis DSM 17241]
MIPPPFILRAHAQGVGNARDAPASPDEQYARIQAALLQKIQINRSLHRWRFLDYMDLVKRSEKQAGKPV